MPVNPGQDVVCDSKPVVLIPDQPDLGDLNTESQVVSSIIQAPHEDLKLRIRAVGVRQRADEPFHPMPLLFLGQRLEEPL